MKYSYVLAIGVVSLAPLNGSALAAEEPGNQPLQAAMVGMDADVQKAITRWLINSKADWPSAHLALIEAGFQFERHQAPCLNYTYLNPDDRSPDRRSISVIWCEPSKVPMVLVLKVLPKPGPQLMQPQITQKQ